MKLLLNITELAALLCGIYAFVVTWDKAATFFVLAIYLHLLAKEQS